MIFPFQWVNRSDRCKAKTLLSGNKPSQSVWTEAFMPSSKTPKVREPEQNGRASTLKFKTLGQC